MKTGEVVQRLKEKMAHAIVSEIDFCGQEAVEVHKENLKEVLSFLKRAEYEVLTDLTGVDYLHPEKRTKVVYWLQNPHNYERVRIVVFVGRDEAVPSVIDLWAGADWYERELFDLFGVRFEGHPDLKRILMPDDWHGHPLRRDYALTEEPVEFKHGVKPKVPSEIIPAVKDINQFNPFGTYARNNPKP